MRFFTKVATVALLAASAPALMACDLEGIEATPFVDGERSLSDEGAFNVELWSTTGAAQVGPNAFELHLAMPNPGDPDDLGWGIPDARIEVSAFMPVEGREMNKPAHVTYLGDGIYLIRPVHLDRAGIWQVDVDIEVGHTIQDSVAFTFAI